jgi:hypothetical protein
MIKIDAGSKIFYINPEDILIIEYNVGSQIHDVESYIKITMQDAHSTVLTIKGDEDTLEDILNQFDTALTI